MAEEELQRQKEYFRSLAENSPDIIMRFDRRLRYLYINPAGEQISGWPLNHFRQNGSRTRDSGGYGEDLGDPDQPGLCHRSHRGF